MKTQGRMRMTFKMCCICAWSIGSMIFTCFSVFAETEQSTTPATEKNTATTNDASIALNKAKADAILQKIVEDENNLLSELEDLKITATIPPTYEDKVFDIKKRYQTFVNTYPKHLYGKILFGKFLQKIDEPELANRQFLDANDLDPNVAVVKQQLGNYLVERGEYALAIPYFLSAIDLEPNVAVYHYQLGELLSTFRTFFLRDKIYTTEVIDKQTLEAFSTAAKLDSNNRTFQVRYAESFFDVDRPNYAYALKLWDRLLQTSQQPLEQQFLFLRKAQVLIELKEYDNARKLLNQPFDARYVKSQEELLEKIPPNAESAQVPASKNTSAPAAATTSKH